MHGLAFQWSMLQTGIVQANVIYKMSYHTFKILILMQNDNALPTQPTSLPRQLKIKRK